MSSHRTLSPSAFPGDSGEASSITRERLASFSADRGSETYLRAVAALCADRLLVPVVAASAGRGPAIRGLVAEKETEMSVVGIRSADGGHVLLAFTGMDSLEAWDARARPVPVTLDVAAKAALTDGAQALLLDVAGPDPLVIDGEVLSRLGRGHRLVELEAGQFGWAVPSGDAEPE